MEFLRFGNHPALDFLNTKPVVNGEAIELLNEPADVSRLMTNLGLSFQGQVDLSEVLCLREALRSFLMTGEGASLNKFLALLGAPSATLLGSLTFSGADGGALSVLLVSILDLITNHPPGRIRKCANPDCVLWFLDTSKGGRRRWHDMDDCGNLAKVRNFRSKLRT